MADERIDFTRAAETETVCHQLRPERETRPQAEKERAPDSYQRTAEKEGRSEWSGGSWGGRSR